MEPPEVFCVDGAATPATRDHVDGDPTELTSLRPVRASSRCIQRATGGCVVEGGCSTARATRTCLHAQATPCARLRRQVFTRVCRVRRCAPAPLGRRARVAAECCGHGGRHRYPCATQQRPRLARRRRVLAVAAFHWCSSVRAQ
jgi:hypothetical protein